MFKLPTIKQVIFTIALINLFIPLSSKTVFGQMNIAFADTLEQTILNYQSSFNMKGVAGAVVFPDGSTWSSATGNYGDNELNTNVLFDIGSNTKSMISAIVLLMEEEELLSIEDTLYHFISPVVNVPYGITLKELMNQTSGIANYTEHEDFFDAVFDDTEFFWHPDSVLIHFSNPPLFEAGADWSYSNTNYILLGKVIEAVDDAPLNEVLYNRLFSPNGLNNSFLDAYDTYALPRTGAYFGADYWETEFVSLKSTAWSAGAVIATPDDFALWCYDLCSGNFLTEESMTKLRTGITFDDGSTYGLGIEERTYNGRPYLLHGGTTMQNSEMDYSIDTDFSVVVMNLDQGFYAETRALQVRFIDILEFVIADYYASVEENEIAPAINAFPNPSNNQIQINFSKQLNNVDGVIEVYNSIGELVFKNLLQEEMQLNKEEIGTGVFLVKVFNENSLVGYERIVFN